MNTPKKAHVIVISNEKGGTGKSTISMHLAIKILQAGFNTLVIDMDGRQGTLSHYIHNRIQYCQDNQIDLQTPQLVTFAPVEDIEQIKSHAQKINQEICALLPQYDAIIIDTPGNKNYLFEEAHKFADTLITPISDSLIDLNGIAEIDISHPDKKHCGHYAEYIWDVKKYMAMHGKPFLNWIVVGNKVSSLKSHNKKLFFDYLNTAAKTYGFRVAPAIRDRVIYKELFLQGLTVLDMNHKELKCHLSVSQIAAKQEIRKLAEFICPSDKA